MTTMYETMWELAGEESGVVLVVRSTRGDVFGAFVNEALRENNVHYGDGSWCVCLYCSSRRWGVD